MKGKNRSASGKRSLEWKEKDWTDTAPSDEKERFIKENNIRCRSCGCQLVVSPSGYMVCPKMCLRMMLHQQLRDAIHWTKVPNWQDSNMVPEDAKKEISLILEQVCFEGSP